MSNTYTKADAIKAICTINAVDGFEPAVLAVEYTDLNTKETRTRLPVMAQLAWFRLKYPDGRIAVTVEPHGNLFVAHARVYANCNNPIDCFLAEATVSREPMPDKPTVSPREWAQTAAVGKALRNAGFGLQFDAAGDGFDTPAADETGGISPMAVAALQTGSEVVDESLGNTEEAPAEEPKPLTYEDALLVLCPISKHKGKTLGEVLKTDPSAIAWLANKYAADEKIRAAALLICEHAANEAA